MKKSTLLTVSSTKSAVNKLAASQSAVNSAPANVVVGQPFWLQLSATNAKKLFLINSTLQYNSERIATITSEDLPVWEAGALFGPNPQVDVNFRNDDPGLLAIGVSPEDDASPGIDGNGEFLRIKMLPRLSGLTSITWLPDSGAYTVGSDATPQRIDATFNPLDLQISGVADGLVISLHVLPA